MNNDCVKCSIDITPQLGYILASHIDAYVDDNLSECSACTYYEESGTLAERLLLAVQNEMVMDACLRMIELEKSDEL